MSCIYINKMAIIFLIFSFIIGFVFNKNYPSFLIFIYFLMIILLLNLWDRFEIVLFNFQPWINHFIFFSIFSISFLQKYTVIALGGFYSILSSSLYQTGRRLFNAISSLSDS